MSSTQAPGADHAGRRPGILPGRRAGPGTCRPPRGSRTRHGGNRRVTRANSSARTEFRLYAAGVGHSIRRRASRPRGDLVMASWRPCGLLARLFRRNLAPARSCRRVSAGMVSDFNRCMSPGACRCRRPRRRTHYEYRPGTVTLRWIAEKIGRRGTELEGRDDFEGPARSLTARSAIHDGADGPRPRGGRCCRTRSDRQCMDATPGRPCRTGRTGAPPGSRAGGGRRRWPPTC